MCVSGPYPRAHFRDVLHTGLGMTDAYMMERVMVALDRGTTPYVTMQTFAKAFSLYLRGDLEERIAYAFTVCMIVSLILYPFELGRFFFIYENNNLDFFKFVRTYVCLLF